MHLSICLEHSQAKSPSDTLTSVTKGPVTIYDMARNQLPGQPSSEGKKPSSVPACSSTQKLSSLCPSPKTGLPEKFPVGTFARDGWGAIFLSC